MATDICSNGYLNCAGAAGMCSVHARDTRDFPGLKIGKVGPEISKGGIVIAGPENFNSLGVA
jgi:hypothetical protein